jgi:adenylosuccinate synthase
MKKAILIADIGFGDAGKGSMVDYLTRQTGAHTIIRYNGGAQAAHNVITSDGLHHTFAQFGSGSFIPGVNSLLSRFMLIHPPAMLAEERHLRTVGVKDAFSRMMVDREALIISPYQQAANRLKEIQRGSGRHGSCGLGIGETKSDWLTAPADALTAGELTDINETMKKLERTRLRKLEQLREIISELKGVESAAAEIAALTDPHLSEATAELFRYWAGLIRLIDRDDCGEVLTREGTVIFEGAQGVLLDEWWGFYPYNSWSNLTFENADTLLNEAGFDGETQRLGLTRIYSTRHGAGPMVTEDEQWTRSLDEPHNRLNDWQQDFRCGPLDLPALRYALQVIGPLDGLAITHLDRLQNLPTLHICDRYAVEGEMTRYLTPAGDQITPVADPTDLESQAALTRALFTARPILSELSPEPVEAVDQISSALGTPTLYISNGQKSNEKNSVGDHEHISLALA